MFKKLSKWILKIYRKELCRLNKHRPGEWEFHTYACTCKHGCKKISMFDKVRYCIYCEYPIEIIDLSLEEIPEWYLKKYNLEI